MSILTVTLVVLAAFIHAAWNLLAKRAADGGTAFVFVYTAVACVCYMPWVIWLLASSTITWNTQVVFCIITSGVFHLLYSLFLQRGYQVADYSVVYPIARGTAPMLSSLGAYVLLGEQPSESGVSGLAAIVIGIFLISTQGDLDRFSTSSARRGFVWGTLTAMMIAGYTLIDAWGVKALAIYPVILDWCSQIVRIFILLPWMLSHRQKAITVMKGKWVISIATGILSPLSYILVLLALSKGAPLSFVAPAREMSMMVGALLGMLLLREHVGFWRFIGCIVLVIGVIMLTQP